MSLRWLAWLVSVALLWLAGPSPHLSVEPADDAAQAVQGERLHAATGWRDGTSPGDPDRSTFAGSLPLGPLALPQAQWRGVVAVRHLPRALRRDQRYEPGVARAPPVVTSSPETNRSGLSPDC